MHAALFLADSVSTIGTANTVFAILASTVVVLGGIVALVRVIWRVSNMLRDATVAIGKLTAQLNDLTGDIDTRLDRISERVHDLEVKTHDHP